MKYALCEQLRLVIDGDILEDDVELSQLLSGRKSEFYFN